MPPLGQSLQKRDTRIMKTTLGWKDIMEDPNYTPIERRILNEMAHQLSLQILCKSSEDIRILRKTITEKLCSEDQSFARHYFMSLFKEI